MQLLCHVVTNGRARPVTGDWCDSLWSCLRGFDKGQPRFRVSELPELQHHGKAEPLSEPFYQIRPEECLFRCLFQGIFQSYFSVCLLSWIWKRGIRAFSLELYSDLFYRHPCLSSFLLSFLYLWIPFFNASMLCSFHQKALDFYVTV